MIYNNAIQTTKPMFLGSSNPTVIPKILSDLIRGDKSKMAAAIPEVLKSPLVHVMVTQFNGLTRRNLYVSVWYYDLKSRC